MSEQYAQYVRVKNEYPDGILLIVADGWATAFDGDAHIVGKTLSLPINRKDGEWSVRFRENEIEVNVEKLLHTGTKVILAERAR